MATISIHGGSKVARAHNLRDPKVVEKEPHIRPDGEHETWVDEDHREAYDRIFGEALRAYNDKQKREDRKISSYYDKIKADEKKHAVYEVIAGVYGDGITDAQKKQICREYVDGWKARNPSLELIGAYWHNDEQGGAHLHLDYVPVSRNNKRGLSVQNALNGAFEEMGIVGDSPKRTAQMIWQEREREALERISKSHGIDSIEHPDAGHGAKHLHKLAYEAQQEAKKAKAELEALKVEATALRSENEELKARQAEAKKTIEEVDKTLEKGEKHKARFVTSKQWQGMTGLWARFGEILKRENAVAQREREVTAREIAVRNAEHGIRVERQQLKEERNALQQVVDKVNELFRQSRFAREVNRLFSALGWTERSEAEHNRSIGIEDHDNGDR